MRRVYKKRGRNPEGCPVERGVFGPGRKGYIFHGKPSMLDLGSGGALVRAP